MHTKFTRTGSGTRFTARSTSNAKAAMPLSKLRLSAAAKCRPKRHSASARSAALWTRGHASPASCCGAGRLREATPAAGSSSRPAATPEGLPAAQARRPPPLPGRSPMFCPLQRAPASCSTPSARGTQAERPL